MKDIIGALLFVIGIVILVMTCLHLLIVGNIVLTVCLILSRIPWYVYMGVSSTMVVLGMLIVRS